MSGILRELFLVFKRLALFLLAVSRFGVYVTIKLQGSILNELFQGSGLDPIKDDSRGWFYTLHDKVMADEAILEQIQNNPEDQVMYGDFPEAVHRLVEEIYGSNQRRTMVYRNDPKLRAEVPRLLLKAIKLYGAEIDAGH